MPTILPNFNGTKFLAKYPNLTRNDFWIDGNQFVCPSMPDLKDADLLDCITTPEELSAIDRIRARLDAAIQHLKQYPWSKTSQSDWQTYFNLNLSDAQIDTSVAKISSIATAKVELAKMWKLQNAMFDRLTQVEIALRDIVKPDNPEE